MNDDDTIKYAGKDVIPKYPECGKGNGVLEGLEHAIALVRYLTARKHPSHIQESVEGTRNYRLDMLKAFPYDEDLLARYYSHL